MVGDDADAALVVAPDGEHALALGDADARMREHSLGELARHAIARRRATRVHDPPSGVAPFETESIVELDAEFHEITDTGRGLRSEDLDRARATQATACPQGVLSVELRIVVLAHRGRDAALGKQARRREQWPLRHDENLVLCGGAQRGEETRHASADDDERNLAIGTCLSGIGHGSFSL